MAPRGPSVQPGRGRGGRSPSGPPRSCRHYGEQRSWAKCCARKCSLLQQSLTESEMPFGVKEMGM